MINRWVGKKEKKKKLQNIHIMNGNKIYINIPY